jgi:hypothetical protein
MPPRLTISDMGKKRVMKILREVGEPFDEKADKTVLREQLRKWAKDGTGRFNKEKKARMIEIDTRKAREAREKFERENPPPVKQTASEEGELISDTSSGPSLHSEIEPPQVEETPEEKQEAEAGSLRLGDAPPTEGDFSIHSKTRPNPEPALIDFHNVRRKRLASAMSYNNRKFVVENISRVATRQLYPVKTSFSVKRI